MATTKEILAAAIADFDNYGFDSAHDFLLDTIASLHIRRDVVAHSLRDGKLATDSCPSFDVRAAGREAAKAEIAVFEERIAATRLALATAGEVAL